MCAQSVKERFGSTLPDIIVIDPLRNVFDGGGFGGKRRRDDVFRRAVEALQKINPNAGIIIAHHTKKIFKKQTEEDPFNHSAALGRSDVLHIRHIAASPDESRPERTLLSELRNGREITRNCAESGRLVDHHIAECRAHISTYRTIVRYEEAAQNRVYTARQFDRFENHAA